MGKSKAVIFGCEGLSLSQSEKEFFTKHQPLGYILFQRNCDNPEQVKRLTDEMRAIAGRDDVLILIDQEGGRVARLKPPHWRKAPSAADIVACAAGDEQVEKELVYLNALLLASELKSLGITVNCAPLADIPTEDCDAIIGDRAYGDTAEKVSVLAREMSNGLLAGGVLPVLKHIPGHGRSLVDSHLDLPEVDADLELLRRTDFVPFKQLNDIPLGMTAHIKYTAIDAEHVATLSPLAIELIRNELGFDGLLMSDDLSMKALQGDFATLTKQSLGAGCDIVLHCNGKMKEMVEIAENCRALDADGERRAANAWAVLKQADTTAIDVADIQEKFTQLAA